MIWQRSRASTCACWPSLRDGATALPRLPEWWAACSCTARGSRTLPPAEGLISLGGTMIIAIGVSLTPPSSFSCVLLMIRYKV